MENSIRLQSIGMVKAIPASELKVGMRVAYNFGYTYDVVSIAPKGKQSISVGLVSTKTGEKFNQTMRLTRNVAGYYPKQ